ncbi:MAG TPA: hypothetical protein DEP48_07645 [Persephonella sp.]|uniref:Uncharacterized protein n=1 Tax=Persephonella marina (strain DSM 14350 / EX-H1) TaxID=123214 RepID=C0QU01_PERMH|nr:MULTISPECIES: hypothetical protein [Persephonella]ACO04937.1 hypothetical protein PERMA_0374 [Persephonella marina EX-H1]HCB70217.1 hypothetical protein [Persephonella sp.]
MKKRNPFTAILILTGLMLLPFMAFLFDRFLLKLDNTFLIFAEMLILSLGVLSGFLIYIFFFK